MERSLRVGPLGVPKPIPGLSSAGRGNSHPGGKETAITSFLTLAVYTSKGCVEIGR